MAKLISPDSPLAAQPLHAGIGRRLHRILAVAALMPGLLVGPSARAASFACSAAKTFVEQSICSDPQLSQQDELVAQRYRLLRSTDPRALGDQRAWLAERNACKTVTCLRQAYADRLDALADAPATSQISLPGSVAGGIEICRPSGACQTTAGDAETPAFIISEDAQGQVLVRIGTDTFTTDRQNVSVTYKGCDLTLRSYDVHSFCPGVR